MAGATQIPVSVGLTGGKLFVKPHGSCSVAICGGVRSYLSQFKPPGTTDIYFDLSEAGGMDSTFIGFLISLLSKKGAGPFPAVHLLQPSAPVLDALRRMYVLPLFDVCQSAPPLPITYQNLALDRIASDQVRDLVIETHENLIAADSRNASSCKPVVEGFRADRDKKNRAEDS